MKSTPRGTYDYMSTEGILALRWKDNRIVTILSSDEGLKPVQEIKRYDRQVKKEG